MRFLLSFAYRMHTSPEQDVFGFSYVPLVQNEISHAMRRVLVLH